MKRTFLAAVAVVSSAACLPAQSPPPPAAVQITSATAALPAEFQAQANVLGYVAGKSGLTALRSGTGPYVCLADNPNDDRFHVACYHQALDAFMVRGRELRAQNVANVDSVRFAEIDAGKLKMPTHAAALYSLTGKPEHVNLTTGEVSGARPLYVVYIPYATPETSGIPAKPEANRPWLMFPGTAKAHIMFVPSMGQ